MKKQLTLLLALVATVFTTNAQISFDADTLKNPNADSEEFDYSDKSYLTNNTTDESDSNFIWQVIDVNKPTEWDVTVCSGDLCIPNPTTEYSISIPMGAKEIFKLGFSFYDTYGDGVVTIEVKSAKDESIKDSLTLDLHARSASIDESSALKFKAYPNPAKDFVTIELLNGGKETIKIYDILGNLQMSKSIVSGDKVDIHNLAKGIYVIRIEGETSYSQVLHKQ